ncbi:MAG: HAD family phosphatase [Bryobacteraceae bacterium]
MSPYDAILFDFDGVLVDSEPIHYNCWCKQLAPLGISLDWDSYQRNCIGVADRQLLEFYAKLGGGAVSLDTLRDAYARKKLLFRQRMQAESPFLPQTLAAVKSLSNSKIAVVTSSGRFEVEPVLRKAGVLPLLGALVCGEDVQRHKPDPEPYLTAARQLGAITPLVFEDSAAGIASARAAGFEVVVVNAPNEVAGLLKAKLGLA